MYCFVGDYGSVELYQLITRQWFYRDLRSL